MFRVRLGQQLGGEDLSEICLLALGSTGADVERITKDAARFARHQNRQMQLGDLRRAPVDVEERAPPEVARAAGHEAGHILMEILLFGEPENLHANVATSDGRGGATMRTKTDKAGEFGDKAKAAAARTASPFSAAIEAGKDAYVEEKRKNEAKAITEGRASYPIIDKKPE